MSTRVYQYGLRPPDVLPERVRQQMRAGHTYYNKLIELERLRRDEMRAALAEYGDVAALEQSVTEKRADVEKKAKAIKRLRKTTRSRSETKIQREELKTARQQLKDARALLSERRRTLREDAAVQARVDQINEDAGSRRRAARGACEAYWGTYLLSEAAVDAAAETTPMYDGEQPQYPRFRHWSGDGAVSVQIQGGMPAASIFGDDTRCQILPVDERAWWSLTRSERRRLSRTRLRLRVGSEGRDPMWAEWPMIMNRPLPEGGIIKRVTVHRRLIGPRERWTVDISVQLPDEWSQGKCGEGAVAIDVGWRQIDDTLRVATWRGEDGEIGDVRLDAPLISALRKAASLRSTRDRNLDEMRPLLSVWLQDHDLPEWLTEATETLPQWRSPARFASLARKWRDNRFSGDDEGYQRIESWRYHDHHLWEWETSQSKKAHLRRREHYRRLAATLSTKYHTLVLEQFDLRPMVQRKPVGEEEESDAQIIRANRTLVAVSELRSALINAFHRRGGAVTKEDPSHTTDTCHLCGSVEKFDHAADVHHRCSACGVVWDQDHNATANLLRVRRERLDGNKNAGSARKGKKSKENEEMNETKWQRVARLRKEKNARQDAARKTAGR